jgi:hypothetical protein
MSNIHPHDLHQAVRSWLLAEDPYGMNMNQRQEPTFPDMRAPMVGQAAVANATAPPPPDPRNPTAQAAGESAVEGAVDERNPRAQFQGVKAVRSELAPELAPPPMTEMQRLQMRGALGDAQGKLAAAGGFAPTGGGGGGGWAPGESEAWASSVGQSAVEGTLAKKARGKIAKGRLKDPVDEDDKSPD